VGDGASGVRLDHPEVFAGQVENTSVRHIELWLQKPDGQIPFVLLTTSRPSNEKWCLWQPSSLRISRLAFLSDLDAQLPSGLSHGLQGGVVEVERRAVLNDE
jgi:hypothetical protein